MTRSYLAFVGLGLLGLAACGPMGTDAEVSEQQEKIIAEAQSEVGLPAITHFTEKRVLRSLYEKRDQEHLLTYTYVKDMEGRLHHLCDSVGYGFPYATQYSNPEHYIYVNGNWTKMPQAEPNGLFVPPGAEGTWVQCIGPGGKIEPMYEEDRVTVSPWPLRATDSYAPVK